MNNQLQVFNHEQFGEVRTIYNDKKDEIWFVAKDIADTLGLTNTTVALQGLEDFERTKLDLGRQGETNMISESGMYALVIRSRKPQAKQFRIWVTSEVLPSIRKHGAYMTDQTIDMLADNPDLLIELATKLKKEREKRRILKQELEEKEPTYQFGRKIETSEHSCDIGVVSTALKKNGFDIGKNRFMKWLRKNGYLISSGERRNLPTQRSLELKIMEVKTTPYANIEGEQRLSQKSLITPKGLKYFLEKYE